ncbi:MAG: deoxyribose-phosphate aldolase [Eubacteriales bacterium]
MKVKITSQEIAQMVDYAILKPQLTKDELTDLMDLAVKYGAGTIFVRPSDTPYAKEYLKDKNVRLASVVGFPHGTTLTSAKIAETKEMLEIGCDELDMVLNISQLKSGDYDAVYKDIQAVNELIHSKAKISKVILETCFLTDDEIKKACEICTKANVDFTKTSTGFGSNGATIHALKIMRANTPDTMGVKASGGIRTLEHALSAISVGVSRLGTSSIKEIVEKARKIENENPDNLYYETDTSNINELGDGY